MLDEGVGIISLSTCRVQGPRLVNILQTAFPNPLQKRENFLCAAIFLLKNS
jgi:hypothetical protein